MGENLPVLTFNVQVEKNVLVHTVVVVLIVWIQLISPDCFTRFRPAGEQRGAPLVIPWPLVGIPWTGVRRSVVNKIEVGIIRNPAPGRGTSDLPQFSGPGLHPEILALILRVVRLEIPA